jgi:hypothetical protein
LVFDRIVNTRDITAFDIGFGLLSRPHFERFVARIATVFVEGDPLDSVVELVARFCIDSSSWVEGRGRVDVVRVGERAAAALFHDSTFSEPIVLSLPCGAEELAGALLAKPRFCQHLTVRWRDSSFHLKSALHEPDGTSMDPESRYVSTRLRRNRPGLNPRLAWRTRAFRGHPRARETPPSTVLGKARG